MPNDKCPWCGKECGAEIIHLELPKKPKKKDENGFLFSLL